MLRRRIIFFHRQCHSGFGSGGFLFPNIDSIEYNVLTSSRIEGRFVYWWHQIKQNMNEKEIVEILKRCANFKMERHSGYGSIAHCPECKGMTQSDYDNHYARCKKELEALPWEKVVENPRLPQEDEYPGQDGEYITMLDANEHEVLVNAFINGSWILYNRTHVKWWMPLTQAMIEELSVD